MSSFLYDLGTKSDISGNNEGLIKESAAAVFIGGADTVCEPIIIAIFLIDSRFFQSVSTLKTFLLAMVLYPDIQAKAQQELDSVLRGTGVPEFDDRSSLPYVVAVMKETLRWHPLLPLGLPHAVMEDDVVGEYFVPKGTVVFGNSWYSPVFFLGSQNLLIEILDYYSTTKKISGQIQTSSSQRGSLILA